MSILCLKFTDAPPRTWGSPVQTLYHLTPDLLSDQVLLFPLYPTIRICTHPSRLQFKWFLLREAFPDFGTCDDRRTLCVSPGAPNHVYTELRLLSIEKLPRHAVLPLE